MSESLLVIELFQKIALIFHATIETVIFGMTTPLYYEIFAYMDSIRWLCFWVELSYPITYNILQFASEILIFRVLNFCNSFESYCNGNQNQISNLNEFQYEKILFEVASMHS